MLKNKYTIGVYGIQDINNSMVPTLAHDHAIAVFKGNELLYHAQLERLNRKKYSDDMPIMLYKLLKEKQLLNLNADMVFVDNVSGRSFINREGNIRFEAPLSDVLKNNYETGRLWWLDKTKKAFVLNHELAHLGSCLPFFGEFENNSLLIHFDGGASLSNFSAWLFKNNELRKIDAHWKLKKISSLFNANALTFGIMKAKPVDLNGVPGKLMGFASYGTYKKEIHEFLEEHSYFENCWKSKKPFFEAVEKEFGLKMNHLNQKDSFVQDVAATIQQVFIDETFAEIERIQAHSQAKFLYYSGGSALNIVLNTKIIASDLFENVFIPPCCNDSGLALGAAAFMQWEKGHHVKVNSPYLNNWHVENSIVEYTAEDIKQVAKLLVQGKIIGISNGSAEIGPRALGNRSLLCLANSKHLAQKVSMEVKQREWYRPVAPIMLEKNAKYFTGLSKIHHLSRYMLLDFHILKEKKKELQGAVHVDGTARIQSVFKRDENPYIYDLLTYLDDNYGVKALINTSFNGRGEPIVHTESDAKKSARFMKLDAVVINGKLSIIEK